MAERAAPVVRLGALDLSEQVRVLEHFKGSSEKELLSRYPGLMGLDYGFRSRGSRLFRKQGLVLKAIVRKKLSAKRLKKPIPSEFTHVISVRRSGGKSGRSGKKRRSTVLIPVDVVAFSVGQAMRSGALIKASSGSKSARGMLAGRITWLNSQRAWISAAHVLTRHPSDGTKQKRRIRNGAREIGTTIPTACWKRPVNSNHRADYGLVLEEDKTSTDINWRVGRLTRRLRKSEVLTQDRFFFYDQDDKRQNLSFHAFVGDGRIRLRLGASPSSRVVTYPPVYHFRGSVRPGDSGSGLICRTSLTESLAGVVVGRVAFDGKMGVAVLPAYDVMESIRINHGYVPHFSPL